MRSSPSAIIARKRAFASRLTLPALAFIAGGSFAPQAYAQNLVVNPGFETYTGVGPNEFTGWTDPQQSFFFGTPHTGTRSAGTGVTGHTAPLYQDIALVAGAYRLSFYAEVNGAANSLGRILQVSLGGQQLLNQSNPTTGNNAYQFYTFNYTQAVAGNSRLEFDVQNDPAATLIDDVSLTVLAAVANNLGLNPNLIGLAQAQNQRAVAAGLTNAFNNTNLGTVTAPNGTAGTLVTAFNNTAPGAIPGVLDSLSGEGITGAQNVAYRSSSLFVSSISDQTVFFSPNTGNSVTLTDNATRFLAYAPARKGGPIVTHDAVVPASRTWRAWTTGFGAGENIRGDAGVGTSAQTNSVYGGTLGVDYQFASNYLAGVAIGGTDGSFSVGGRNTFGSTTGGHAAFYTLANFGAFYGAGTSSVSFFGNRTTRNIAGFGGLAGETERGNFASREFRSRAEFGWHTGFYGTTLTPFVALEIAQLRSNGFTEGALAGPGLLTLNVQGQTAASVPGYLGARISRSFMLDNGMVFTPTIQAAYLHEFGPQRNLTAGLVNLPGSTFLVDGARASSNAAQIKAGAELTLAANLRAFATFDGEFSGIEQVYAGKAGLRYSW